MHNQIQSQIKKALMAKDQIRLTTLRGVLSSFTNESVALKRTPQDKLSDDEALAVLKRLAKQRKDSITQFEAGGRSDLADNEKAELKIIEEFLPAQMSEDEVRRIAKEVLRQAQDDNRGAIIGRIIKESKGPAYRQAGQVDGSVVKKIVEELLA